jgi:hypothetical protein
VQYFFFSLNTVASYFSTAEEIENVCFIAVLFSGLESSGNEAGELIL